MPTFGNPPCMLLRMPGHADGSARRYRERNSTADRALDILLLFTAEKPVWAKYAPQFSDVIKRIEATP